MDLSSIVTSYELRPRLCSRSTNAACCSKRFFQPFGGGQGIPHEARVARVQPPLGVAIPARISAEVSTRRINEGVVRSR
jgi:hypothetical protein